MFITKKHILPANCSARRRRYAGVAVARFHDSGANAVEQDRGRAQARFIGIFVPHGMAPGYWIPGKPHARTGKMLSIMEPLDKVVDARQLVHESFLDQTVILSGIWSKSAEPPPGVTGADHWVAAAYMCANKPKKTTGSDIQDGTTIDQLIAQKIGQEIAGAVAPARPSKTPAPIRATAARAIAAPTPTPFPGPRHAAAPMELNPQVVFERLFGDVQAKTPEERAARREQDRSILDSVTQSLARFKKDLPANDRARLDEYTDDIREIERRLEIAKKASAARPPTEGVVVPSGIPESFDEHVKLHFDLQRAGLQGRHHPRFDDALCARPDRPRLSRERFHQQLPWRIAPRRESGPDRRILQDQSLSRPVPGVLRRKS